MELVENTLVAGRFRLSRLIGKGGMGSVWQATHVGLDIQCAVKFIEGDLARVPELAMRFEREAKAAAKLQSPNVVQILDHGVWEGIPYIAMELMVGEDLGKRFERVKRMPPRELSDIVTQVCRGLGKAHGMGIVHRDLKPDNIFLVRDEDREIAKVLDFGIAKTNANEIGGSNTKTGAMLGTPYYMSPEQARGIRTIDFRTDLWSMAVIVFQGLTGALPFESDALGDLIIKIVTAQPPTPSQVGCALPGIDQWWARAIAGDPAHRFQSAREFADSLAVVCGVTFAGRESRESQVSAPAFPLETPLQTPPLQTTGALGTTPSPMAATVNGPPTKSAAPLIAVGVVALVALAGGGVYALTSKSAPPPVAAASSPPPSASVAAAPPSSPPAADSAAPTPPPTAAADTAAPETPPLATATHPSTAPAKPAPATAGGPPGSTKKPATHDTKPSSQSKPPEFGF